ncbi:MAG: 30S ribosomal protein S1 [Candidatus Doudnabacteria bacterium Gr01-1014_77]|uniref:30S ribosomal protein S1 n=1 Tax=Candidatus Doudnabacteria bacterium Gr01-1014_77 TaxID=2017133 RepID=A0A554JCJ5_9BACT|nr:MAG: 30S ribosomal protein S1 [Candidatus Doudnabacteria bacterium Gr01-1014_77]
MSEKTVTANAQTMNDLIQSGLEIKVLKPGEVVAGKILSVGKNEVYVDIEGYGLGVVRGRELYDDEATLSSLKPGDEVFASVVDIENKDGNIELSFRQAGQERVWSTLQEKMQTKEIVRTKILEANKGGLMVEINNVMGFLPVSQLSTEHYPRVEDGDKNKILSVLNQFVGTMFDVQIITADQNEEKLIVSEKAVFEKDLQDRISKLKIGDIVTGTVSGIVDFGVFVKFGELEGLVHISELAWQRIEHPKDIVKVGQEVKAVVIGLDKGRISLSMKQLEKDPWQDSVKKYQIGQVVKGKVSKIMPFGVFVELDDQIQGLAHLMELSHEEVKSAEDVLKVGDEKEFKIISIEPQEHRLGLSIKALTEKPEEKKEEKAETTEEEVKEV